METTFKITGPFAEGELLFRSLSGQESISSLYEFKLQFLCADYGFDPRSLIGEEITLTVEVYPKRRYLGGLVTRITSLGKETSTERYYIYEATIRPWLWLATQTNHYKIYQNKTIPEVINETLRDYPFNLKFKTIQDYREWGYCVQYDETDFEFVSRLMEHEGLYYWFEHEQGQHTLVIADDRLVHEEVAAFDHLKFYDQHAGAEHTQPYIYRWQPRISLKPAIYSSVDYNLNKPNVDLHVQKQSAAPQHHGAPLEVYQAIGDYTELSEGERYAAINIEIFEAQRKTFQGESNSPLVTVGAFLGLERHPDAAQNQQYLITGVEYDLAEAPYATNEEHRAQSITKLSLIPKKVQYRQPKLTPIPYTYGPQTAVVVGPEGESIWTDKYGRVKVKFHWDNSLIDDGDSSCWVRVSSPWAGSGFGGMQIPRVNEEVIVDFLGGHPDRPVIVGRLYNADNMPPVELPENATVSGFHTRTKDGNSKQANSVLFEDALGSELLTMVAQKSMDYYVKNDSNHQVGGASATNVGGAHQWNYGGLLSKLVGGDATYQHESGHTLTVAGNSQDTVHQRQRRSYTGPNTETTGGTEQLTVAAEPAIHAYETGYKQHITGLRKDTVSANKYSNFQDAEMIEVSGVTDLTVEGGDMYQNAKKVTWQVKDYKLSSGGAITDLSVTHTLEAGAKMSHLSIDHSIDATTQKQEQIALSQTSINIMDEKLVANTLDRTLAKVNLTAVDLSQQVLKAGAVGLQVKIATKTNDKEQHAGSLIGIDLSKMNLEKLQRLVQLKL